MPADGEPIVGPAVDVPAGLPPRPLLTVALIMSLRPAAVTIA
jgi:hypothetical protein